MKAISPLIAVVMLVVFSVAIAGLLVPFGSDIINTVGRSSESQADDLSTTSTKGLEITEVRYDGSNLSGSFQNTGNGNLTNFSVIVEGDTVKQTSINSTLGSQQVETYYVDGVQDAEQVKVTAKKVPVSDEEPVTGGDQAKTTQVNAYETAGEDGSTTSGGNDGGGDGSAPSLNPVSSGPLQLTVTSDRLDDMTKDDEFRVKTGNKSSFTVSGDVKNSPVTCSQSCTVKTQNNGTNQINITAEQLELKYDDAQDVTSREFPFQYSKGEVYSIRSIDSWGDITYTSFKNSFNSQSSFGPARINKLIVKAENSPNLSSTESAENAFRSTALDVEGNISSWNTGNIKDMSSMFHDSTLFDSSLKYWDTSNVTDMSTMFKGASRFDQNISSWCVSKISDKPFRFDRNAGFEGDASKQPEWGTSNGC